MELLTTLCSDKLEESMGTTIAAWSEAALAGDYAAAGYPLVRFRVDRSDDPADGGMADRLMAITATVWEDANSNGALDSGEPSVVFRTKVASLGGYPL
jgi:hypothetical protein